MGQILDNSKNVDRIYLQAEEKYLAYYQALASKTRLKMVQLLRAKEMAVKDLADALELSRAVTTRHIQILEQAGIVESYSQTGVHGLLKMCRLKIDEMVVIFNNNYEKKSDFTEIEIPICSYSSFEVKAPCGMANADKLFGRLDDPRYFAAPNRHSVHLLWFSSGYLEYLIPTFDMDLQRMVGIEISLEICSEYPGYNNSFPSDVYFALNGKPLGKWLSPGDFGGRKGKYTPEWWSLGTEFGVLKKLMIRPEGVFLDGIQISRLGLADYLEGAEEHFIFRISCPSQTEHPGGINLFGRNFGDYDQNILVKCIYGEEEGQEKRR